MFIVFVLLFAFCTVMMILGLIKPNLALIPFAKKGRGKAFLTWFLIGLLCFVVISIISFNSVSDETVLKEVKQNSTNNKSTVDESAIEVDLDESGNVDAKNTVPETNTGNLLSDEEFEMLYYNPNEFKNRSVNFTAKVFSIEKDQESLYLQIWAEPSDREKHTIIKFYDSSLNIKEDDYVLIQGEVVGEFTGRNAFNAKLSAPKIIANSIEIIDYIAAVSPSIKTMEFDEMQMQNECEFTLEKIEFSELETRVYLKIYNGSEDELRFYPSDSYLTQGRTQFDFESNYDADYEEPKRGIKAGIETSGIITFPPIDLNTDDCVFFADLSSSNWNSDFEIFEFVIDNN
jgi:hypothetical protein